MMASAFRSAITCNIGSLKMAKYDVFDHQLTVDVVSLGHRKDIYQ
jgi:hypothetical protein